MGAVEIIDDNDAVLDLASLHPKQTTAFTTPATEVLYGGAAGGGKSHFMRVASIAWAAAIPGLQIYLFRRKYPDLWKNHMEGPSCYPVLLQPWIEARFASIQYQKNTIEFWNGSKIFLCHAQHEKDVYNYLGAEIHVLLLDELTTFTDKMYRFLRSRVRMVGIDLAPEYKGVFPRVLCSSNPGNVGHNWVKAAFIDIAPEREITQMPRSEGGMKRQYIRAVLDDNPSLDRENYIGQLEGLGNEALVRAMRDGDWDIIAGGMFDDLWSRQIHVIDPFVIPQTWRIDRSFDWGSSKPFSVGWWAESDGSQIEFPNGTKKTFPRGTVFRIGEWYGWNGKPNEGLRMTAKEIARGILDREKTMGIAGRVKPGPADSAIFDTQNGNCIADDMALVGVQWVPADKSPGSRVQGWESIRSRLQAALQNPMEEPGIFCFSRCTQFIRTVPVLPRDADKPDDVDTDAEDHIADEVRYRVHTRRKSATIVNVTGA